MLLFFPPLNIFAKFEKEKKKSTMIFPLLLSLAYTQSKNIPVYFVLHLAVTDKLL